MGLRECCAEWDRTVSVYGYGVVNYDGKLRLVHRLVWEAHYGPISSKMHVHHRCHNRLCFNIYHLELMTPGQHRRSHGLTGAAAVHAVATTCAHGHPFDGHNGKQRTCSVCLAVNQARWEAKHDTGFGRGAWKILTEEEMSVIRTRHAQGESQAALAREYLISRPRLGRIVRTGKTI